MKKISIKAAAFLLFISSPALACNSSISSSDGWQSIATAPRDGTIVETAETYGIAPWYGLYQWKQYEYKDHSYGKPAWISVQNSDMSVEENECLFWRPFHGTISSYVDPTDGAQNTREYWLHAIGK